MEKIILLGAGSHLDAILPVVEKRYSVVGLFDDNVVGTYSGYPILGEINFVRDYLAKHRIDAIHICIGNLIIRRAIFEKLEPDFKSMFVNIIASSAIVLTDNVGIGNYFGHNSYVGSKSKIGNNCILNTGCIVEHHSIVNDHCHVSTNATLNGRVTLGDTSFIGSGAVINQVISIASRTTIGAGSVVINNIEVPGNTYVGVPAKMNIKKMVK